jgi:hypothetical protein
MDPLPELPAQDQQAAQPPAEELPRRTLLILVIVFCIIALLSTLAVLYQFATARGSPTIITNTAPATGHASLTIGHPAPPPSSNATGVASFTIRGPTSP